MRFMAAFIIYVHLHATSSRAATAGGLSALRLQFPLILDPPVGMPIDEAAKNAPPYSFVPSTLLF